MNSVSFLQLWTKLTLKDHGGGVKNKYMFSVHSCDWSLHFVLLSHNRSDTT